MIVRDIQAHLEKIYGEATGYILPNRLSRCPVGVNFQGKKEVLGFWIADTEGAKFWMNVLSELKNRGEEDILIACTDGLTGFPDAIRAVYPETRIQLCIVHMIRNSTKYVSYKDIKSICADLKVIYTAASEKTGREALEEFGTTWNSRYPMIYRAWLTHWEDLNEFFNYPPDHVSGNQKCINQMDDADSRLGNGTQPIRHLFWRPCPL